MGASTVFINVLVMLFYMACGFFLVKGKKAVPDHAKSLSGLLVHVCGPCLVLSAFQKMEYSPENSQNALVFFGVCMVVQLLFFAILYVIFRKKYDNARYRILTAGSIFGNVGYFGLPLVTALFPNHPLVACYSTMYITAMNILVFTLGVFLITHDRRFISLKQAFLNPTSLAVLVAVPLYLLQIRFPAVLADTVDLLGKMTAPLCMVVLGLRLAAMNGKEVFARPFAYLVCALKLLIFPLFAWLCVWFLPGVDEVFRTTLVVLSAAPSAAIVLSLSELYGQEQKMSANVVLLATVFSAITLPLLLLFLT